MSTAGSNRTLQNFGGNLTITPQQICAPRSEDELLAFMSQHRGRRFRAVGRLHSWSDAPLADDLLVDLQHLNSVSVRTIGGRQVADVGAGCQIKRLLDELQMHDLTLPSLGLITEQSIAGAAATGTHGSGGHSLSHYIESVRLATFDVATGEPMIRVIDRGAELEAARCSLGTLGIVTSVTIPVRRQYMVEEHFRRYATVDEVLDAEERFPLQQFFLVPSLWSFVAQHRREVEAPRSRSAWLYRLYWAVGMDVLFHILVRILARHSPYGVTRLYYRRAMLWMVPWNWKVVDRSDRQLTMQHQLFRHIEIEIFVTRRHLPAAIGYITWLLRHFDGQMLAPEDDTKRQLEEIGEWSHVVRWSGRYHHHYPICIRKILPDDTLISMASGDETCYSISFISYAHPSRRNDFFEFAEVLARTTAKLFDARPHWGKYNPLDAAELRRLYPRFDEFCAIVKRDDPAGTFGNDWTRGLFVTPATKADA